MKPETKDCPLFFVSGRKDTMINLLVKIFVKNPEDIKNSAVRQSYGVLSGGVGICCNILLFCFKFLAGILTGAVSVAADAFNNLSDAGSSVITLRQPLSEPLVILLNYILLSWKGIAKSTKYPLLLA